MIDTLIQNARSYIYTTAASPIMAATLQCSLKLLAEAEQRRQNLQRNIAHLRHGLSRLPWHLLPSITAIQPLLIGDNTTAQALSQYLFSRGIWVPAIRPPTVPQGTARLRISLSADHQNEHIEALITNLHEAVKKIA